jgi:hypothetical protein
MIFNGRSLGLFLCLVDCGSEASSLRGLEALLGTPMLAFCGKLLTKSEFSDEEFDDMHEVSDKISNRFLHSILADPQKKVESKFGIAQSQQIHEYDG